MRSLICPSPCLSCCRPFGGRMIYYVLSPFFCTHFFWSVHICKFMYYFSHNKTESNEIQNRRLAPLGLQISGFVFAPFYWILLGRSERDSNSRYAFGVYTLSRRASSATRASLLVFAFAKIVQIERRKKSLLVFSSEMQPVLIPLKICFSFYGV